MHGHPRNNIQYCELNIIISIILYFLFNFFLLFLIKIILFIQYNIFIFFIGLNEKNIIIMYILKKNCYNNKYSVFIITNNLLFIEKII